MYNEKLEQLIDAALADGELTEKEKQILFKKAQEMGVDLDEFEMVLDARLVKLKKAEEEKAKSSAPKSNKLGDVKKCPACGAIVQSYQGVCAECGYAFENIEANSSSQKLAELLDKVIIENNALKSGKGTFLFTSEAEESRHERIKNAILNFPIPNTKSDLFEFITSLHAKKDDYYGNTYMRKLDECILKAKVLCPNDPMFIDLLHKIKEDDKQKNKKNAKTDIKVFIILLLVNVPLWIGVYFYQQSPKRNIETCSVEMMQAIKEGDLEKATELFRNYNKEEDGIIDRTELYDEMSLVMSAYLEKGDILNAENILEIIGSKLNPYEDPLTSKLYKHFIKIKEYNKARSLIEKFDSETLWGTHIKDVVVSLCEDGKKEDAKKYLNQHKSNISNCGDKLYPESPTLERDCKGNAYVTKLIKDIINTY